MQILLLANRFSLYRTLHTGASIASWVQHSSPSNLTALFLTRAESLKSAIMTHCWDPQAGMFKDNATNTKLYPQDANSMAILFGVVSPNGTEAQSISRGLTRNWTPIGAETPELPGNISPFISSFEIQAHFIAGQTERAFDLIKRCWGWYLKNPNGTQSTVIEGYLTDSTFGYRSMRGYGNDPSYVSHAHGWSTGPTSALTEYVVGLSVIEPAGAKWTLKPNFDVLNWSRAGFTTPLGKYEATWKKSNVSILLEWSAPEGTLGYVEIPGFAGKWIEGGRGNITIKL